MKAAANFKIEGEIPISSDLQYKFWAKGIDGYDLPEAELSLAQATAYPVKSTTEAFDSIKFYADDKIFKFEWFMQRAKEESLETKITETKNDMYVIKAEPATLLRQETLYHIACKKLHGNKGTNEQEMVDKIYAEFQTVAVKNRAGDPLYYYLNGFLSAYNVSTASLLKDKDGRCGAWGRFFKDCALLHNIDGLVGYLIIPDKNEKDTHLLVHKYNALDVAYDGNDPENGNSNLNAKYYEYSGKKPLNGEIGVVYAIDGIKAQNNTDPKSNFTNHLVVFYNGKVYDPSYGTAVQSTLKEWENISLWGFITFDNEVAPNIELGRPKNPEKVETLEDVGGRF